MVDIKVTLQVSSDITLEEISIPGDMRAREIIEDIVGQVGFPWVLTGREIKYSLLIVNSNYYLTDEETLASAGVADGSLLRLVSSDELGIDVSRSLASANISASQSRKSAQTLRIFLCHSSGDKQAVRALYKRLRSDGFDPWFDEEQLLPGQDWNQEIIRAVRSSDVVLICLSEKAINKAGYVQKEIKYALDVADEQPEGSIFLIPVRLEECGVPPRLSQWQWVDYFEDRGYGRLLKALEVKATQINLHAGQDRRLTFKLKAERHHYNSDLKGFNPIEQPFPFNRVVRWSPRDVKKQLRFAKSTHPTFYLVITQEVLLKASEHVCRNLGIELGGFLLGNHYRCSANNLNYVIIDQLLIAEIAEATEFSFGPTQNSWGQLSSDLCGKLKGKQLLGWYHSHPGLDVFLSQYDLSLHKERFNEPWMTALVIEPEKHLGGFFCWRDGRLNPHVPIDFYELMGHTNRNTVLAWNNYTGVDTTMNIQPSLCLLNTHSIQWRSQAIDVKPEVEAEIDEPNRSTYKKDKVLLEKVFSDLINLTRRSKFIKCQPVDVEPNYPPRKYIATFTCLGIASIDESGSPQFSEFHQVSIYLPDDYPIQGPHLRWLTPIWHPNIEHTEPKHVDTSLAADQHSNKSLDELLIALGEMIQYKRYHAEPTPPWPLDMEVAAWVREYAEPRGILNKDKPVDKRGLI